MSAYQYHVNLLLLLEDLGILTAQQKWDAINQHMRSLKKRAK